MTISTLALTPLISLIAGVLILVMPRLLNYIRALSDRRWIARAFPAPRPLKGRCGEVTSGASS